ncbi:hypothetical protein QTP86_022068 [Hemibagrus guttatus]|nr:hypothetical protein QTP86_022068 [Hemibagrus guttatus]
MCLELNFLKTMEMIVDFRKDPAPLPPVILCDSLVTSAESFRFLGTTITKELKWEQNIRSLTKKAQQRIYFLRQLKKFLLPVKMLVNFYTAIIESILTSSITVWFAMSDYCNAILKKCSTVDPSWNQANLFRRRLFLEEWGNSLVSAAILRREHLPHAPVAAALWSIGGTCPRNSTPPPYGAALDAPTPPPSPENPSDQGNPERSEEHGEATRGGSEEQGKASGGSEVQGEAGGGSEEPGEVSGRSEEQSEANGGRDGHDGKAGGSQTTSTAEQKRRATSTAEQGGRATSPPSSRTERRPPPSSSTERRPLTRSRDERRSQPGWAEGPHREGGREVWPAISSADEE